MKMTAFGPISDENGNNHAISSLKIPMKDLIYGPYGGRKVREFQERHGGHVLGDLKGEGVYENGFGDIITYSCYEIDRCRALGRQLHFDLTYMDDIPGVLNNSGLWANKITSYELRHIRDNWNWLYDVVKFYMNDKEVPAPWINMCL